MKTYDIHLPIGVQRKDVAALRDFVEAVIKRTAADAVLAERAKVAAFLRDMAGREADALCEVDGADRPAAFVIRRRVELLRAVAADVASGFAAFVGSVLVPAEEEGEP